MTRAADRQQGQRATPTNEPNQQELDTDADQLVDTSGYSEQSDLTEWLADWLVRVATQERAGR